MSQQILNLVEKPNLREEKFVFEILETVKVSEEPDFNLRALRRAVVPGIRMDPSLGQSDSVTTVTVA